MGHAPPSVMGLVDVLIWLMLGIACGLLLACCTYFGPDRFRTVTAGGFGGLFGGFVLEELSGPALAGIDLLALGGALFGAVCYAATFSQIGDRATVTRRG